MTKVTVARVIDGDTIELIGGQRVRLIGIDAPELGSPGGNEATQFVKKMVEGRDVWLQADGDSLDRFGRMRRYVWLREPTDPNDENQMRLYQLNTILLLKGLARPAGR